MSMRLPMLLLAVACAGCAAASRPRELRITGTEYRFEAPAVAAAGLTAVTFRNAGRVRHELILMRLKPGVKLKDLATPPPVAGPDPLVEGGTAILLADPGAASADRILVDLAPGATYALACTMRDAPGARPHYEMGMATTMRVQ